MNSFFELANKDLVLTIFTFLSVIIMTIMFARMMKIAFKYKTAKSNFNEKFFKLLDAKFKKELVKDKGDVLILLNSLSREFERDFSFAPIIEDYLSYLTGKDFTKEKDDDNLLQKNYSFLKQIIEKENEEKPFSNTPEEERRLLRAIDDSLKNSDTEAINYNLQELNSVISTRYRIYQKATRINKWSIPVALIGFILTIIFGIMSITQKIDYQKIEQFNKNLIEQVLIDSQQVKK